MFVRIGDLKLQIKKKKGGKILIDKCLVLDGCDTSQVTLSPYWRTSTQMESMLVRLATLDLMVAQVDHML